MKQIIKLNAYKVETVTICPYCMSEASQDESSGCCGESSAHFETAYLTDDGELHLETDATLTYPVVDVLRYEVFSRHAWRQRITRLQRRSKNKLTQWYDGQTSIILKLRQIAGFQWSRLDCFILKQLHDFPLYYTSPKQLKLDRQASVKSLRESWSRGELLGCNLVPPIQDGE